MLTQVRSPILVLGGAYAGKSEWAMQCLAPDQEATVIGTADPQLVGSTDRLGDLRAKRPGAWHTRETYQDLPVALIEAGRETRQILVDSLNQWVAHIALQSGDHMTYDDRLRHGLTQVAELVAALQDLPDHRIAIIASEVGGAPASHRPAERLYRQLIGLASQAVAKHSQTVVHLTAGLPQFLKGTPS